MDKGTVSGKEKTGHLVNCEYKKVLYIDNLVQKAWRRKIIGGTLL